MSQPIRLIEKQFGLKKKNLVGKQFWSEKILVRKKNLVGKKCWSEKNFGQKKIWDQEKGAHGKRFPHFFYWEPFSFLTLFVDPTII